MNCSVTHSSMNSLNERVRASSGVRYSMAVPVRARNSRQHRHHILSTRYWARSREPFSSNVRMHRVADLGVAGLVGLNARQRLLEQVVVGAVGHRRHRHELEVGEAGLEHEVELDRAVDCVGGKEHVVEQVPGGENHPLVGVERLVRPVEVAVVGQHVVADQQRDLGVPDLVERAQASTSSARRCRGRSGPSATRRSRRRIPRAQPHRCGT